MPALGQLLRQGRESRNLSLQAVAGATKIREHILVALENENYDALPAPVFVRGFLRTLARHLALDSAELLGLYEAVTLPAGVKAPVEVPARRMSAAPRRLPMCSRSSLTARSRS